MSIQDEIALNQGYPEAGAGESPRYMSDIWCDKCQDFISMDDSVGYVVTNEGQSLTLCSKHYEEYLNEEEKREREFRRKQFDAEAKKYGVK